MNAEGRLSGHFAHLRKNVSLASVDTKSFPHLVLVNLAYYALTEDGRPCDDEELTRVDETEERLAVAMCSRLHACFALCVTSDGTRALFFFLPQPVSHENAKALIESIEPSVDWDFTLIHDPDWRPWRDLLP